MVFVLTKVRFMFVAIKTHRLQLAANGWQLAKGKWRFTANMNVLHEGFVVVSCGKFMLPLGGLYNKNEVLRPSVFTTKMKNYRKLQLR